LTSGELEFVVAAALDVPWGEPVDDLQLALAFDGEVRPYRQGELVGFKVYVRNVGDKEVRLAYDELHYWCPAVRESSDSDKPFIVDSYFLRGDASVREEHISLQPGDTKMLGKVELQIEPRLSRTKYSADLEPGKYRVTQTGRFGRGAHDSWQGELTSGELELVVEDLRFGQVIERVLAYDGREAVLDLDNNKTFPPIAHGRQRDYPGADIWAENFVHTSWPKMFYAALCHQTMVWHSDEQAWNDSPAHLLKRFTTTKREKSKGPYLVRGKEPLPVTFLFKTHEGGVGILQVVGFTEQPLGTKPEEAAWSRAVDGLRLRTWLDGTEFEIGEPIPMHFEFQNVSDQPLRTFKDVTIDRCFNATWATWDGRTDTYSIEHYRENWDVKPAETVVIPPGRRHHTSWTMPADLTRYFSPGPVSMKYWYDSPPNINKEVAEHFWSGVIKGQIRFSVVGKGEEHTQAEVRRRNWPHPNPSDPPTDTRFKHFTPRELFPYVLGNKSINVDGTIGPDDCRVPCAWFIWKTRNAEDAQKLRGELADRIVEKVREAQKDPSQSYHRCFIWAEFLGPLAARKQALLLLKESPPKWGCHPGPTFVKALAICGTIEDVPALIDAIDKESDPARALVNRVLYKLTGVNMPLNERGYTDKAAWKKWWQEHKTEAATRKNSETQALKILFADANLPCGARRLQENATWNEPYRYVIHSYPDYLDACQYIFMRERGGGAEGRWFNTGDVVVSQPCWLYAAVWKPSDKQRQTWEKEGWQILPDILRDLGDPRWKPRRVRDYTLMRKRVHKGPVDFETKAEKAHMVIWIFDEILLAQYEIIRLSATLEVDPAELARESVEGAKLAALIEGLKDNDSSVRSKAAAALLKMGPAAKPAIPALMYALMSDSSRSVRSNAAFTLGEIKDPIAVPALILALKDVDEYVSRSARNALIRIGKPAVERLIVALKARNRQMRHHAAEALRQIGDKRAAEAFIAALRDKSPKVRELAAWALGGLQDNRAVMPLIGCLNDEHKVQVRAIEALGNLRDSRAVEPLIALLKDKNSGLRRRAAQSLGMIGDNRAVESLIPLLTDDEIYRNVAWALGEIADKRAVEPLIARLNRELQHRPPISYLHEVAEALGKPQGRSSVP
jgi:HEAT repeat protein